MNRIILLPVPICILVSMLFAIIFLVGVVTPNAVTISLGLGTVRMWDDKNNFHPFPGLHIMGRDVPLWTIVCSAWLVVALPFLFVYLPPSVVSGGALYATYGAVMLAAGAMLCLVAYLLYLGGILVVDACSGWDGWRATKEYLKAKHKGVCPLVDFEGSDQPDDQGSAESPSELRNDPK